MTLHRGTLVLAALVFFGPGTAPPPPESAPAGPDGPTAATGRRPTSADETSAASDGHEGDATARVDLEVDAERAPVDIREWTVPWENTRPRDPYVRERSRVWFVGQRGNYLAYLEPETGDFERYDLDPGTGPHNLIVARDGSVWYAGNRDAHIGHLDPSTGEITEHPMPDPGARDPHTLVFDSRGDIWFTVQGGNFVGKLDTESGDVRLVEVPSANARPYGIKVTPEDRPWIALLGTNKLATVDPESFELTEYELPREDANPRRLGLTSDGAVWYVDYSQGYLGRFDPETEEFQEWRTPSAGAARPYGMAVDDQDRIWFVETGRHPNLFVGFDPESREFFSVTEVPSGGGTIRHMYHYAPADEIWFGADTNTVGRARVP